MNKRTHLATRRLCLAAVIATLYVIFTFLSAAFGLDRGVIQFRISEAFCILAAFTPAALPGLTVGCLLSGMLSGAMAYDIIFGTLATFIGMLGAVALRKLPFLVPLPYVAANTLIIPLVLRYAYGIEQAFYILALTVGMGEFVCAYGGGILLYLLFKRSHFDAVINRI